MPSGRLASGGARPQAVGSRRGRYRSTSQPLNFVRSPACRISRHHPPAAGRILCCSRWRDPSLAGSSLWRSSTSGSPRERSPLLAGHLRRQGRRRRRPRKRLRLRARQQARPPSRLQGPRRGQRTPCCTGPVRYGLVEQTWTPCRRMPPQGWTTWISVLSWSRDPLPTCIPYPSVYVPLLRGKERGPPLRKDVTTGSPDCRSAA